MVLFAAHLGRTALEATVTIFVNIANLIFVLKKWISADRKGSCAVPICGNRDGLRSRLVKVHSKRFALSALVRMDHSNGRANIGFDASAVGKGADDVHGFAGTALGNDALGVGI